MSNINNLREIKMCTTDNHFVVSRVIAITFVYCLTIMFSKVSGNGIEAEQQYGVASAESSNEEKSFCILYLEDYSTLPDEKSKAEFHALDDKSELDWCEVQPDVNVTDKAVLASNGNCSISQQVYNIHDQGGSAVLFIIPSGTVGAILINETVVDMVNMTVGLISGASSEELKEMVPPVKVALFTHVSSSFDLSLIVLWILALVSVTVGSFWSGHVRLAIHYDEMSHSPGGTEALPNPPCVPADKSQPSALSMTTFSVPVFVLVMGLTLTLLYFFYDYLVYFIIGVFVLASAMSIYSCFGIIIYKIPEVKCGTTEFSCWRCKFPLQQIFLATFSMCISIIWLIYRKESYIWILQDVLGMLICINMLKNVRLPNFKICTILLCLLFFYDIFFVFVTPLFTVEGESVMEQVVDGGKSDEAIPVVFKVSHLQYDPLSVCYIQFSILGYGDILLPGLLISYLFAFDLITSKRAIYFPVTVIVYVLGLLSAFGGLFLMQSAQPALMYIVPIILVAPVIVGWYRGELQHLWGGFQVKKENPTNNAIQTEGYGTVPPTTVPSNSNEGETPTEV